jgi:hypothetical protein
MTDEKRDQKVTTYLTQTEKDRLAREADDRGISTSKRVAQLIETDRQADAREDALRQSNAEAWLEGMADDARAELERTAESIADRNDAMSDMVATSGAYSIVAFAVLKRLFSEHEDLDDLPETWIDDQFADASERLRDGDPGDAVDTDDDTGEIDTSTEDLYE